MRNDSFAAVDGLPHGDVAAGVTGDDEVVDLAEAHDRVILVNERNVRIVEGKLDLTEEISRLLLLLLGGIIIYFLALFIDDQAKAVLFVVVRLRGVRGHDDALVLLQQLLGAVEPLAIELVVTNSVLVDVADLGVATVLYGRGVVV